MLSLLVAALVVTSVSARLGTGAEASQGGLVYPVDIVAGEQGIVIADFKAHGLLRVGDAGAVSVVLQGQGMPRTPLYGTRAVVEAPDGNGWLVADPATFALYRVDDGGSLSVITTELDIPQGLARYDGQSVLVADARGGIGVVYRITLDGSVTTFAEIRAPKGIAADGDDFVVVSYGERALYRLTRDGATSVLHEGPPFDYPHDVVALGDGRFAVTDGYASAVFVVTEAGEVTTLAQGAPLVAPQGITVAPDGDLLVVDPQAGAVLRVDAEGTITRWLEAGGP